MNQVVWHAILAMSIFFAIMLFFAFFAGRYLMTYKVDKEKIGIKLFWVIPYFRISIQNIDCLEVVSVWEATIRTFGGLYAQPHLVSTLGVSRVVLIRKKRGLFKYAVLTPKNPDQFVEDITGRMKSVNS